MMMATAATQITPLIALALPGTPYSVRMARFYVRAALTYHDLGDYAEDTQAVTSELVTNAIEHAGAPQFGLQVVHLADPEAVAVMVTDPSPWPPVKRDLVADNEHGRGLHVVEALSDRWGWQPAPPGKAVYAILTREA
jgi:anti-sigma regulatory factor (Ser/Thr protein kinase)